MRRRRLPMALIVVATLIAFVAIFAVWANRQLLNTDNWVDTSTELLEEEEVREQLSVYLVDQLYANVDVQGRLQEALPPRAVPLAAPVAGALRQVAERASHELLNRPRGHELWEEINRRAHDRFLEVLDGGGEIASTEDGVLVLDLKALLEAAQEQVGVGGRVAAALPEDAAQLTIIESDTLELAQDLVDLLKALAIGLVILALGLFALAIYLAKGWRREALRASGYGFIAAGALALIASSLAGDAVVDALVKNDAVVPAADATWTIATSLLEEAAGATLAYGIVMVLAAWLGGPTGAAVSTRAALSPWLRSPAYAYGALSAIVLLLIAWAPTPATRKFGTLVLLIALLALGMELLRRQAGRENPDASREEAVERMRERFSGLTRRGAPAPGDRVSQLERLGKLRDEGVLEPAEFELEKKRLLTKGEVQ